MNGPQEDRQFVDAARAAFALPPRQDDTPEREQIAQIREVENPRRSR